MKTLKQFLADTQLTIEEKILIAASGLMVGAWLALAVMVF